MKVWVGYGSEHSYNLVMIGHFVDESHVRSAEEKFKRLTAAAENELPEPNWDSDKRFTTGLSELLDELKTWDLSRSDVENFAYSHTVSRSGNDLRIETDEGEVQGFLKILIDGGARVEVYSAHEWTDAGEPRMVEDESQTDTPAE